MLGNPERNTNPICALPLCALGSRIGHDGLDSLPQLWPQCDSLPQLWPQWKTWENKGITYGRYVFLLVKPYIIRRRGGKLKNFRGKTCRVVKLVFHQLFRVKPRFQRLLSLTFLLDTQFSSALQDVLRWAISAMIHVLAYMNTYIKRS